MSGLFVELRGRAAHEQHYLPSIDGIYLKDREHYEHCISMNSVNSVYTLNSVNGVNTVNAMNSSVHVH